MNNRHGWNDSRSAGTSGSVSIIERRIPGAVYFIVPDGRPFVKIGWTTRPIKRLLELQTGNPDTLRIAAIVANPDRRAETRYHRRFMEYRIDPEYEWFRLEGELAEYVDRLAAANLRACN